MLAEYRTNCLDRGYRGQKRSGHWREAYALKREEKGEKVSRAVKLNSNKILFV
jgi:hypothetical protein